ncbi:MAG: MopE-related protein, partial [Myxococcota bacterium]|nr:MopE-related protein [Myxococcota bacterium]
TDPARYPGATDIANDGIDQDGDDEDYTWGLCDDTCSFAGDGACDDGGPNASFSVCDFGTDCTDCSGRDDYDEDGFYDDGGTSPYDSSLESLMDCDDSDSSINPDGYEIADDGIDQDCDGSDLESLCDDSCTFANDGQCDDGGTGSDFDLCDLGTDCTDCGSRLDADEDGLDDGTDCDDRDAAVADVYSLDTAEPTDFSSPISLGSVENVTLTASGYLTDVSDQDAFTLYAEDGIFTAPDFICTISAPADLDISITLYDIDGAVTDTGSTGLGGSDSVGFVGGWGDDTGTYTIVLEAPTSTGSCSTYSMTCTEW